MQGAPAGFWIRFVAIIIDSIVVFAIGAAIWPLLFGETFWVTGMRELADGSVVEYTTTQSWHTLMLLLYNIFFIAFWGATPGKALLNIRVYDAGGRERIGVVRATIRALSVYLSVITLLIGFIMAGVRKDKRALHDLIAGTYPTIRNRRR